MHANNRRTTILFHSPICQSFRQNAFPSSYEHVPARYAKTCLLVSVDIRLGLYSLLVTCLACSLECRRVWVTYIVFRLVDLIANGVLSSGHTGGCRCVGVALCNL